MTDCPTPDKVRYRSRRSAKRAVAAVHRRAECRAYKCPAGWHWHITSEWKDKP